jgi:prolyl 4-hydroxylase
MDILDQAHRLAASGQQRAAVELVQKAAEAGDAVAQYAVANWRLYGLNGGRDFAEAHRLLDGAVASGSAEAVHLKANLVANGTGVAPDPDAAVRLLETIEGQDRFAARQLKLVRSETRTAPAAEALSADPDIRVYRGMLSRDECDYLIERAQPELRPSFVVDPSTGGHMPHPTRTSFGMSFDPPAEDLVVRLINQRFATVTGSEIDWGEPLHVLRYAPGQEFRPHFDAIPGAANQRSWTVLTYLNDEYEGGETVFDLLGIRFRGERGDALLFRNADEAGISDSRLRHAGRPVISGIKWLATRWIRTAPHDPWAVAG